MEDLDDKKLGGETNELSDAAIAAYSESVAHHGGVIQQFSSQFVQTYALFNAGALAACIAFLPTKIGNDLYSQFGLATLIPISLFTVGFLASTWLMVVLYQNSLARYRLYRHKLGYVYNGDHPNLLKYYISGTVLILASIGGTFFGLISALVMFYNSLSPAT